MSAPWKRKEPLRPPRKAVRAAFNAQAPLDAPQPEYQRKKPRKWKQDSLDGIAPLK